MAYYVPDGNWTSIVSNSLGTNSVSVLNFGINIDIKDPASGCEKNFTGTYTCGLNSTEKSVSVDKPADGKTARFDCSAEFAKCNDLKLTLTDDGKLTLTNNAGTTTYWNSATAFGARGTINTSNADILPIAVPINAGNGVPNSSIDVGSGGGPGRRYPNNYLLSGQFLDYGQWIGSPTGTCRLMMGTKEEPNTLQVVGSVPDCDSLDLVGVTTQTSGGTQSQMSGYVDLGCWRDTGDRALKKYLGNGHTVDSCAKAAKENGSDTFGLQFYGECWIKQDNDDYKKYGELPGTCPPLGGSWSNHVFKHMTDQPDPDATRLYTIPNSYVEHVGKAGHVDNYGQLQIYPSSMTSYNDNYEQIGNYNSINGILKTFTGSSVESCQEKCTTGSYSDSENDTQKCAGFVFDTTSAMCKLLDNSTYQNQWIIKPTSTYYAREKGIKNQHVSCPVDIITQPSETWNATPKNPAPMTPTTKCGLAYHTDSERNKVGDDLTTINTNVKYKDENNKFSDDLKFDDVNSNETLYNKNKNSFKYWMDSLQNKYSKLTNRLFKTKTSLKSTMDELEDSKQNLADWTGEQLQNLAAMREDRDLNMMSQNYRHIMWSILAIIIIIGTMKMTKIKAAA